MKNPIHHLYPNPTIRAALCALAVSALAVPAAHAHPYAAQVTVSGGTVSYYLNENATDVKVQFYYNGVLKGTTDFGALSRGPQGPINLLTNTSFAIVVNNIGSGNMSDTSSTIGTNSNSSGIDTNTFFFGPRGVAVNMNPSSTNFGRIYVANDSLGSPITGRSTGRGIYALNADQSDAFGYGSTAQDPTGMALGGSTTYGLYKLTVGPDDMVYACNADGLWDNVAPITPPMWMLNPTLTTATNLFYAPTGTTASSNELGSTFSTPYVTGSYAAGTLVIQTVAADGYAGEELLQYNIGNSTLPYTGAFSTNAVDLLDDTAGVICDFAVGSNNLYYLLEESGQPRSSGQPCLEIVSNGVVLWNSWDTTSAQNGGADAYNFEYGIAVTPDQNYMVTVISSELIAVTPLTNGIPNYSYTGNYMPPNLPFTPAGHSGTARGIAVDMADNVYSVSGGSDRMRSYSLGLTTTCITSNDTSGLNGTFSLSVPANSVSVVATNNVTAQNTPSTPGVFSLTRTGQIGVPLTVSFVLSGTATNGTYTISPGGITPVATNTITFAAGQNTTNISITAVNDGLSRLTTTVVLQLLGGNNYGVGSPNSDTVYLINNGPQVVVVSGAAAPTMYKAFSNDYASFYLTRLGDTNNSGNSYTVNVTYGGTAVLNSDFVAGPSVTINPGDVSDLATVSPKGPSGVYAGNKTILPSVTTGTGYTPGAGSTTLTLLDNIDPPATVLYSDPLTDPADAANWVITSANDDQGDPANTYVNNYQVTFGYDLTAGSFSGNNPIPLPPSGATTALFITQNKGGTIGTSAAQGGVNVYATNIPNFVSGGFSGSYAVRFDMNLIEGYSLPYDTEGVLFGINHNATETNWFVGSAFQSTAVNKVFASDGFWYWIDGQGGGDGSGDFIAFTGNGSASTNQGYKFVGNLFAPAFTNAFKASTNNGTSWSPGIYSVEAEYGYPAGDGDPGIPANYSTQGSGDETNWSNVEIKQVQANDGSYDVTMSINKTVIFTYNNTSGLFTNGTVMLGYEDAFDSVGSDSAAYFSNLRVVRLGPISITSVGAQGNNAVINFVSNDGDDSPASFVLQGTTSLAQPITWTAIPSATITQTPATLAFTATTAKTSPNMFYRIRHN